MNELISSNISTRDTVQMIEVFGVSFPVSNS